MDPPPLTPDSPLDQAPHFSPGHARALAALWITTVGQFLSRCADPDGRSRLARSLDLAPAEIDRLRSLCLDDLPPADRDRLARPGPLLDPRPGLGLRVDREVPRPSPDAQPTDPE